MKTPRLSLNMLDVVFYSAVFVITLLLLSAKHVKGFSIEDRVVFEASKARVETPIELPCDPIQHPTEDRTIGE